MDPMPAGDAVLVRKSPELLVRSGCARETGDTPPSEVVQQEVWAPIASRLTPAAAAPLFTRAPCAQRHRIRIARYGEHSPYKFLKIAPPPNDT